jgi:RNA polymerase sigma-70 factor (ECF subfamily)
MADADADDADLLQRWRSSRDRDALGRLADRHADIAYRVARALSASAEDAEDAVQVAFMRVMDHAGQWHGRGSVRAWIIGIVANSARQQRREATARMRREREAELGPGPDAAGAEDDRHEAVRRALAGLADPYRTVLASHYLAGIAVAELAAQHRTTVNTIHSQLRRGIERLRGQLVQAQLPLAAPAVVLALEGWQAEPTPPALPERLRQLARTRPAPTGSHAWALAAGGSALILAAVLGVQLASHTGSAQAVPAPRVAAAPPPVPAAAADPPPPQPVPAGAADDWTVEQLPSDVQLVMRVDVRSFATAQATARVSTAGANLRTLLQQQLGFGDPEWTAIVDLAPLTRHLWLVAGVNHGAAIIEGDHLPTTLLDAAAAFASRGGATVRRERDAVLIDAPAITDDAGHGMAFAVRRVDDGHVIIGDAAWVDLAIARHSAREQGLGDCVAKAQFLATAPEASIRAGFSSALLQQADLPIRYGRIEVAGDDQRFRIATVFRCTDAPTATTQAEQVRTEAKHVVDQALAATAHPADTTEQQVAAGKEGLKRLLGQLAISAERDQVSVTLAGSREDFADLEALALGVAQ